MGAKASHNVENYYAFLMSFNALQYWTCSSLLPLETQSNLGAKKVRFQMVKAIRHVMASLIGADQMPIHLTISDIGAPCSIVSPTQVTSRQNFWECSKEMFRVLVSAIDREILLLKSTNCLLEKLNAITVISKAACSVASCALQLAGETVPNNLNSLCRDKTFKKKLDEVSKSLRALREIERVSRAVQVVDQFCLTPIYSRSIDDE